jgi:hypothetical protein
MLSTAAGASGTLRVLADRSVESTEMLLEEPRKSPKTREIENFKIFEGGRPLPGV